MNDCRPGEKCRTSSVEPCRYIARTFLVITMKHLQKNIHERNNEFLLILIRLRKKVSLVSSRKPPSKSSYIMPRKLPNRKIQFHLVQPHNELIDSPWWSCRSRRMSARRRYDSDCDHWRQSWTRQRDWRAHGSRERYWIQHWNWCYW